MLAISDGINTKERYEEAKVLSRALLLELNKNRCFNCMNHQDGYCMAYMSAVPESYLYQANECEKHEPDVPF